MTWTAAEATKQDCNDYSFNFDGLVMKEKLMHTELRK